MDNAVESLRREVSILKDKLNMVELKLVEAQRAKLRERVGEAIPFTPRKVFTTELRPMTPTSGKRGIKEIGEEVMDGRRGRLREGGIPFDLEGVRRKGIVVGLKLGGVLWGVGIGGVVASLEEVGFILAEGARWLVGERERMRRENISKM